jgi:hypothetical protein
LKSAAAAAVAAGVAPAPKFCRFVPDGTDWSPLPPSARSKWQNDGTLCGDFFKLYPTFLWVTEK